MRLSKEASGSSILTPIGDILLKPIELLFGLPLARVKPLYDTVTFPMATALSYQSTVPQFVEKFPTEGVYSRAIDPGELLSFAPYTSKHFTVSTNLSDEATTNVQELKRRQEEEAKNRLLSEAGGKKLTLESMFKDVDAQITR